MANVQQTNRFARAMTVATVVAACAALVAPAWRTLMLARGCPDLLAVFVHALG